MSGWIGFETIGGGTPYMTRAWIGRLRLHVFHRGDGDPDCHDHPWAFWTFPLTPYIEAVRGPDGVQHFNVVRALRWHYRPAEYAHRVIGRCARPRGTTANNHWRRAPGKIVTVVWRSGKGRAWGFWRDRPGESCWVPWRRYVLEGGKDAPCSDAEQER